MMKLYRKEPLHYTGGKFWFGVRQSTPLEPPENRKWNVFVPNSFFFDAWTVVEGTNLHTRSEGLLEVTRKVQIVEEFVELKSNRNL